MDRPLRTEVKSGFSRLRGRALALSLLATTPWMAHAQQALTPSELAVKQAKEERARREAAEAKALGEQRQREVSERRVRELENQLRQKDQPVVEAASLSTTNSTSASVAEVAVAVQGIRFKMASLKGGRFLMGSPESESGRRGQEDQRWVNVQAFQIAQTEVTQGLWQAVMKSNPSYFAQCGAECPVEGVSWDDAQAFIQRLNQITGQQFRLPTDVEWEYAARAGTGTAYHWGDEASHEQANYGKDVCCGELAEGRDRWETTAPVKSFPANVWGLSDMSGNVWEWIQDCLHPAADSPSCKLRVLRGGSFMDVPSRLRAANRAGVKPETREGNIGLRLVR